MKKIAFIGAGSFGFTRELVKDILTFPAFRNVEIALMDIDSEKLKAITQAVEKIIREGNYPARILSTQDRKEALEGADGVLITILSGGVSIWRHDIEIPKKYGIDINVGDTRGPSGIFRFLRTFNDMVEIADGIMKYCPKAVVLNYTNPMAMLCRGIQELYPDLCFTGLCHSVQGTAQMLAEWLEVPEDQFSYRCAGINHQAWYLELKQNGRDLYPELRQLVKNNKEVYNREPVRNEMFLHLDHYVTESSGHNSEYNPWFRKRPDLIKKYCTDGTNWNPGHHAYILDEYIKKEETWRDEIKEWLDQDKIDLERGGEYASNIFNAMFGDHKHFEFNGNVRNRGYISNLPEGCCVEVPVLASERGLEIIHPGPLPEHIAIFNNVSSRIEELCVRAAIEKNSRKIFQAICMDPLSSAVLSLEEIKQMVDEMFLQNKEYLPGFEIPLRP